MRFEALGWGGGATGFVGGGGYLFGWVVVRYRFGSGLGLGMMVGTRLDADRRTRLHFRTINSPWLSSYSRSRLRLGMMISHRLCLDSLSRLRLLPAWSRALLSQSCLSELL